MQQHAVHPPFLRHGCLFWNGAVEAAEFRAGSACLDTNKITPQQRLTGNIPPKREAFAAAFIRLFPQCKDYPVMVTLLQVRIRY